MISINMVSNLQWIYPIEKITQLLLCEVFLFELYVVDIAILRNMDVYFVESNFIE